MFEYIGSNLRPMKFRVSGIVVAQRRKCFPKEEEAELVGCNKY